MTPSDLTRLEAIREACATIAEGFIKPIEFADSNLASLSKKDANALAHRIAVSIRALDLARLAPQGAATAEDSAGEINALRAQLDALGKAWDAFSDALVDQQGKFEDGTQQFFFVDTHAAWQAFHRVDDLVADWQLRGAPASAERSGAAPEICEGPAATCCCGHAHRDGATAPGAGINGFVAIARNHLCEHCAAQGCDECREIVEGLDRTYFPAPPAAGSREATPHEH